MCKTMKIVICLQLVVMGYSLAYGAGSGEQKAFPFKSTEIVKSSIDSKSNTGYAILSKGRMLYYKRWLTEDSSALELTLIDTNKIPDKQKNWFSDDYIKGRIIWLSKLVLSDNDNKIVNKVFQRKTYKKNIQKNGDIVYTIPITNYTEFYFAVRQPGDYIDDASIKIKFIMTL